MEQAPRVLQDDVFRLEIVDWQGQGKPAVKKSAKDSTPKTRAERIKNDIYGMCFFSEMGSKYPRLKLYIPEVYDSGESYYIREYIEDDPVNYEDTPADEAVERLDQLAGLLAEIDRIEPYGQVRFVGSSNYKNLHKSINRWATENLQDGLIDQAQVSRINQISAGLDKYIQPRIAHGDMSPYKHAYLRADGRIAFIDCENFTPQAARYFDVAWSYTRLWSFAVSKDIPKHFLASFMTQAKPVDHQAEQLMAALIQRTLGMQKDADADLKSKGIDFRDRAKELLELVLQNKLEHLHS